MDGKRDTRTCRTRRHVSLGVLLVGFATACAFTRPAMEPAEPSLEGRTLTYRFDNGRTYRATYGPTQVDFALVAPERPDAPAATLDYRSVPLRENLFLVVWQDPDYHTTFAIDLDTRTLPASALRPREGAFLGTARILSIEAGATEARAPSR